MSHTLIKVLFLDIGGVLMTNGWGHELRERVACEFAFDYKEFSKRHEMIFDLFERGKMTFDDYLQWCVFNKVRNFTPDELKQFIFNAAQPFCEMIDYFTKLKEEWKLKVVLLSNEGRELAIDRINRFSLHSLADFFIVSGFVGFRKPDKDIYRLAIDVSQVKPSEICYVDDRESLIEVGRAMGLHIVQHVSLEKTQGEIAKLFLINGITTISER